MFNGLPPMSGQVAPNVAVLGEMDVNRNGSPPGGLAADLRAPASATQAAAAPKTAVLQNPLVILGLLVAAFLAIDARKK